LAFWYSQNIDFYLIGFWGVLLEIIGIEGQTVTIRPLAKRFGVDKGLFHRQLKRLEVAGMLRIIPQKEGTFLQVLLPVLTVSQHEEEEVFKRQLPLPYERDFQKMIAIRDALEAIFWGCLAAGRSIDELSGSTVNYLTELSKQRSPEYVAGVLIKYIKDARHPLSFLQTVFQKEPDPLSQVEIDRGQGTFKAGSELLRNINRIDELGLNGMREFAKLFTALNLGKTIESARAALETLNEKRNAFLEKWGAA
jgi:DNA-binding MarR family transcriptional regulator